MSSFCPRCNKPRTWRGKIYQGELACTACEIEDSKKEWKERMEKIREQHGQDVDDYKGADHD